MKILHVITSLLPGGAEKLITDLLPLFSENEIEAELAVFNAIDTPFLSLLNNHGVKIYRFSLKEGNGYSITNLLKLQKLILTNSYDIVHTHNTPCQLFLSLCIKPKTTIFVTTEHNTFNRRRQSRLMKYVDRAMYSRYRKIICVSDAVKLHLIDFTGTKIEKKCLTIQNGVNLRKYQQDFRPLDLNEDIIVTMVAAFRKQKDHPTLIKALAALPKRYRLKLVGEGETENDIRRIVAELGLSERTEFIGFSDDIPSILSDTDILVLSSNYEGLSLSCIECMASGRPLIASDVPGLSDIVKDAGILFERGNHLDLCAKIEALANNSDLYESTAKLCQTRAEKFDLHTTLHSHIKVYRQLIENV